MTSHPTLYSGKAPLVIGIDLGTTNSLVAVAGQADHMRYLPLDSEQLPDESSSLSNAIQVHLLMLPQLFQDGTVVEDVLFPSVVFQETPDSPRLIGLGAREAKYSKRRGRTVFYSVKKDLGTDREPFYPSAITPDLNTPVKVSAEILRAIRKATEAKLGRSIDDLPVVITIPASFQSAQRRDTLRAAQLAGFKVTEHSLFDEPNAALLAYMNRRRVQGRWNAEETVLVFDFGGGTCDIAIIDVSFAPVSRKVQLRSLALSRFEQLGGDDIDQHLVHTYLAPQFYQAAGKAEREWSLAERRDTIWSQLGRLAEDLKVRLCEELDKVVEVQGWDRVNLSKVRVSLPPQVIRTSAGDIWLDQLSLSGQEFADLLEPFLDPDDSSNADKEYYRITSIFTPIQDALEKCNLSAKDITRVLLVGGSSRNPLVEQALQRFFAGATIERPKQLDQLVAEGAAVHAYWRNVIGHDILAPIVGDTIGLLAEGGVFVPLIKAGSPIPFPSDDSWHTYTQFRIPQDFMSHVDLVICAGSAARPVHTVQLQLPFAVTRHTAVHLKVRLDGNKIFHLEAYLPDQPHVRVRQAIENPLGLQPMTPAERQRATLEKKLAAARQEGTLNQHVDEMSQLAEVLLELGRCELALEWANAALKRSSGNPAIQRLKARIHSELGEHIEAHRIWARLADQQRGEPYVALNAALSAPDLPTRERYIRQAHTAAPGDGIILFFLADTFARAGDQAEARDQFARARAQLEATVRSRPDVPVFLWYLALTYDALGNTAQAEATRLRYHKLQETAPVNNISEALIGIASDLALR